MIIFFNNVHYRKVTFIIKNISVIIENLETRLREMKTQWFTKSLKRYFSTTKTLPLHTGVRGTAVESHCYTQSSYICLQIDNNSNKIINHLYIGVFYYTTFHLNLLFLLKVKATYLKYLMLKRKHLHVEILIFISATRKNTYRVILVPNHRCSFEANPIK